MSLPGLGNAGAATAAVGGARIYCEARGTGPSVLLLHGGMVNSDAWDAQMDALAEEYRVIRIDMPGYARSTAPDSEFAYHELVHGFIEWAGIRPTAVVALSFSAAVSLDLALTHPGDVSALVLAGPALGGFALPAPPDWYRTGMADAERRKDIDAGVEMTLRLWTDGPQRRPDEVDHRVRQEVRRMTKINFLNPDPDERARDATPAAAGRLPEIRVPTLIIHGEKDVEGIRAAGERIFHGVKGARREVIRGAAHHMNMEKPEEFNRQVLDFLKESIPTP
ncbi:MAG TPA: alpha/beta hydrolase [Thermoplasmata archaeon]|nr:alpha/beta hydrolase [Thermoplasmata archaeon]